MNRDSPAKKPKETAGILLRKAPSAGQLRRTGTPQQRGQSLTEKQPQLPVDYPGKFVVFGGGEFFEVGDKVTVVVEVDEDLAGLAIVDGPVDLPLHEEVDGSLVGVDGEKDEAVSHDDLVDAGDGVDEVTLGEGVPDQGDLVGREVVEVADDADLDVLGAWDAMEEGDVTVLVGDGEGVDGVDAAIDPLVGDGDVEGAEVSEMDAAGLGGEIADGGTGRLGERLAGIKVARDRF